MTSILKDKLFCLYVVFAFILYCVVFFIKSFTVDSEAWLDWWFSDTFFVFQLSTVYLIGCAIIDKFLKISVLIRFPSRIEIFKEHIFLYLFLSVSVITIVFAASFAGIVFSRGVIMPEELLKLINIYFRFFIGLNIAGLIALNIRYSNFRRLKQIPQIFSYIVIITDLIVLQELSMGTGWIRLKVMFSWIFSQNALTGYCILLFWYVLLLISLKHRIKRADLTI